MSVKEEKIPEKDGKNEEEDNNDGGDDDEI